MASRRAVITGIGVLSPIGLTPDTFWQALTAGRSGVAAVQSFDASGLPVRIAGELPGFDAKSYFEKKDRKSLKMMARTVQIAVAAANVALADSRVAAAGIAPARFGIEFGSSLIPTELDDLATASITCVTTGGSDVDLVKWGGEGIPTMPPLWMLKYLPNMAACHTSIIHNAQGPNNSVTQSDAAGILALGEAYRLLRRDRADFFLVGAADSKINPLSLTRQCLFGHLSKRNDDPAGATRPFDRTRDGYVIAEAAGTLTLEDFDHALRRGATIYGELVGFGSSFDRLRDGAGVARAIRAAVEQAGVTAADIDHVNAHASGSRTADAWEAKGVRDALGGDVPVFAAKSYFGNPTCGGSLIELIASLLAVRHGVRPKTLNVHEPDPDCPVRVEREPGRVTKSHFVKVSLTERGQVAAAVIRAPGY